MTIRLGINGFGRIGRVLFRAAQKIEDIEIVAINDILDINYIAYMLKYDSTHGQFNGSIYIEKDHLVVNGKNIRCTSERSPEKINWSDIKANVIIESTGVFLTDIEARKHITAGAEKVIMTGPPKDKTPMFVMGVNHKNYKNQDIISNASCTTNCLAPLSKIINDNFGITEALMTTVHAVTATQKTVDGPVYKDWRSGRGALQNIIPSTTGAAAAVGKIIPELEGKITGMAFRVPISNVSVIDLNARLKKSVSFDDICFVIKQAVNNEFKGIMGYTDEDVVSMDFNGEILTSIFDAKASLILNDKFVKLIAWYDNETGYSNKILDLISYISCR